MWFQAAAKTQCLPPVKPRAHQRPPAHEEVQHNGRRGAVHGVVMLHACRNGPVQPGVGHGGGIQGVQLHHERAPGAVGVRARLQGAEEGG